MKNKTNCLVLLLLLLPGLLYAIPPGTITKHIKIDQFGYLREGKKVAVIADPQTGYNAAESFSPGTGVNQYQVRRWTDDMVVYSGTLVSWKAGITHTQSGDKGWWFDFTTLTAAGSYYIYDVVNNVGSYRFEISNAAYSDVLKQAVRTFYYQRVNFAKQAPYTDAKWADGAAFGGTNQDFTARSRFDKTNPATAKDLHGGWFDAGDYNKYVTFTFEPLCNMLETYRLHGVYFGDNYNIPESGNGMADILDEIKYELDWLKLMQNASGTNGLFLKVGVDNYNAVSPPSGDNNPRYYLPECTSSTLTGSAVFALASTIYGALGIPAMTTYANDLKTRAINAWNRAKATTSNFNIFQTTCDDQDIKSGDADQSANTQKDMVVAAAAYLFEATGLSEYKNCFDTMYLKAQPVSGSWWGPYYAAVQKALLRYTVLPGATASVVSNIRTRKGSQNGVLSITDYNNQTDLYRSYMPDAQYHWGSNQVKANAGINNLDFVAFAINPAQTATYKEVAEGYLHWFHGVNPMGKVMLSNMYNYGGDSCVNEFYHSWFGNGTVWDNVFTSLYGPAPGYLVGGPNKSFGISSITPPYGQPQQKSYKDWNTGWNGTMNENSWEITEPAIYYQAAYISLLIRVMANTFSIALPLHELSLSGTRNNSGVVLTWKSDADGETSFEIQRSFNGRDFIIIGTAIAATGQNTYTMNDYSFEAQSASVYYRIREKSKEGRDRFSSIVRLFTKRNDAISVYPNPARSTIVISGRAETSDNMTFRIFDAAGILVKKENWQLSAGNFSKTLSVEDLPAGNYWLQAAGARNTKWIKLIKQ